MSQSKVWRRGVPFSAAVAPFVRYMPLVDEHRENLLRLQAVWDSLALMTQMSGSAADISKTRSAFEDLTGRLLDSLALRLLGNTRRRLQGKAQVAIDILVRNLFERTADIGFLAADAPVRELLASGSADGAQRQALEARFRAYVAKYSVYDDVILLAPDGRVLARLDATARCQHSSDPLVAQALRASPAFVERHGASDLLDGRSGLLYASAITLSERPGGVLCLSFRLADEMTGIFEQLLGKADGTLLALVNARGEVVSSSDPWQVPVGAPLRLQADGSGRLNFAGREYLAVEAAASGYEGYGGPGWSAMALLPLEQAFALGEQTGASAGLSPETLDTRNFFDAELRAIPLEAQRIQRELSRSLWNGKLHSRSEPSAKGFAVTLLDEIERTGQRLRQVFEQAISHLQNSALSAVFDEAVLHARLAIDIMDRNLYERANDCRWWALDAELQQALAGGPLAASAARLRRINSLYTVYALLLIFDAGGRIVAVSDPSAEDRIGQPLEQDWVAATLALQDRECHVVSRHEPCGLYGEQGRQASYVYAAALPDPQEPQRVRGGVAVVFDGLPQFGAMLRDSLPAAGGAQALFLKRDGRVVASTDERWPVGAHGPLPAAALDLAAGRTQSTELEIDGLVHAVGIAMSGGYREYRQGAPRSSEDVAAVMLVPLGPRLRAAPPPPLAFQPLAAPAQEPGAARLDIASFLVDGQWLGLPARQTLEALERPSITGMPNAAAGVVGMLSHEGQMLPVLDLGQLYYGSQRAPVESPVLVCQTSQGRRLALRVHELGQVFGVPALAPQACPALGSSSNRPGARGERLLRGAAAGSMLTLLDIDALWAALAGLDPIEPLALGAENTPQ